MIRRSSLLLVVLMLLLVLVPASAAQSPGSSPWYAVVYQPQTEMLVWANALGWQGALPRPALPNEAEFRDLRISPDGRTMLLLSRRADGVEQLGVYDFASASLLQTHIAQAGEQINLGSRNIFSVNSQYFAVGLFGGDFTNPTWRVILFETATGNAVAFIDQTHPESPEVPLSAPIVQYVDGRSVHFQLVRQAVGASAVNPAYAWQVFGSAPTSPTLIESAYTRANADVLLLTGEVATTLKDEAYPTAPMEGQTPDFNVVARGYPRPDGVYQAAHVDSTRFHLTARWASGGSSILFYSTDPANGYYWNVIAAGGTPGNNAHRPLDSRITQAFGTSDGYLTVDESHLLAFYGQLGPEIAQPVMQLSPGDRIAYVTPIGITFTLAQLPGVGQPAVAATATVPAVVTPPPQVVTPPAPPALPVDCSQALPPRVAIGNHARVIPAAGSLNLRQQPNGAIITALAGGSEFDIIGGFVCANGLHWWQISQLGMIGWVAESTFSEYFIEPYIAPPIELPEDATHTPMPPLEAGCELAPPSRLSAGVNATVIQGNVRPHVSANGDIIPLRFYLSGTPVSVTAGPTCAGGLRWWLVLGEAKAGHIGNQTEIVQGWVSEGQDGTYNLEP